MIIEASIEERAGAVEGMPQRLNSDFILTADGFYWINAHKHPPAIGSKVDVLNQDGCKAGSTTWSRESLKYFDGWLPAARIPPDLKALQLARYTDRTPKDQGD